jgi:hypothetical protein
MGRERRKPNDKQRPKPGRARDRGDVRLVTVELDTRLDDAIEACRRRDRRTKKAVITLALEAYLSQQGLWSPEPDQQSPSA